MHSGCIPLGWKRHKYNSCHPLSLLHSCNPLSLPQCHSCSQLSSLPLLFAMAFFNVTGTVNMSQGKAIMTLTPEPDIKVTMTRPSTSQLLEKFGAGTVKVHDSRHPVAKRDLTTMMGTIQRQLRLRPGGDGEWSADAQQRLENLLANPKRSTATVQLALEDVKPSSSSSTLEEKKPASSSSTSDSDSDSSSSEGPQHQADAELEKVVSFFTCAMLQLHMWARCVQVHAYKLLSWCSVTIGEKIKRKTRQSRTYLVHKMSRVLFVLSHPPRCSQCSCTYVVSFFTCAMLQLHMWARCVQVHAHKLLSWCSVAIGEKMRRKTRQPRTYLVHKMSSVLLVLSHPPRCSQCSCTYVVSFLTCAMLQLHMWARCVQVHAHKLLSWCSVAIGEKMGRKTRQPRTYLIQKM